jgi:putative ABC transport system permease protein
MSKRLSTPHVHTPVIFKMALANLRYKKFRSLITILGVTIGIGSIYLLLSFGLGLQNIVQGEVSGNRSIETIDVTSADPTILRLSPENISKISSIEGVTKVSGVFTYAGQVSLDSSTLDTVVYGVDGDYKDLNNIELISGEFIDPNDAKQVTISKYLAESLGANDLEKLIGSEISLSLPLSDSDPFTGKFRVSGVIASEAEGLEIFISQKVFTDAKVTDFDLLKLSVENRKAIDGVRKLVESFGFDTSSPIDTLDQVNEVFKIFNLILAGLGGIGLVIAILGMLNTLTVSLLERTREIALMVMIGARPRDMNRLFMIEALLLSTIGGIAGIAIASLTGVTVNFILNQLAQSRGVTYHFDVFYHSPLLIIGMMLLMVAVGLAVSFIPAKRAERINPIEALRHE